MLQPLVGTLNKIVIFLAVHLCIYLMISQSLDNRSIFLLAVDFNLFEELFVRNLRFDINLSHQS